MSMKNISVETQLMNVLGPQGISPGHTPNLKKAEESEGVSFSETLKSSLADVNKYQNDASKAVQDFITGDNKSITDTLSALGKADMSFKLTMQVRNKLLDAYKEVMRMSV